MIKSFIVDILSIKQYLSIKNMFISFVLFTVVGYLQNNPHISIGMSMMMGIIFTSYPFAMADLNQTDLLYQTLPISRKDIVKGRYLYNFAVLTFFSLISLAINLILYYITKGKFLFNDMFYSFVLIFIVYTIVILFQTPMYFKLGYIKAKGLNYAPFIIMGLTGYVFSKLIDFMSVLKYIEANLTFFVWGCLFLILFLMLISCLFSIKIYEKKDI